MSDSIQKNVRAIYDAFAADDYGRALSLCDPKVTFQISGKSKLAGKYDATNFVSGLVAKWKELSGGQYKLEVHDVLASDRHAVALTSAKFTHKGSTVEYRSAQVWRIENGKPVAWYEYLRDGYQFDSIWS
jgi:ketosteroid isomerase-like protein